MGHPLAIGAGAGLVAALLFSVTLTGSPFALLISYLAPLPLMIAGLGWGHLVALFALAVGGAALSLTLKSAFAIGFTVAVAIPAWWLSLIALRRLAVIRRSRPGDVPAPANDDVPSPTVIFTPLGFILPMIAIVSALVTLAAAISIGGTHEGYSRIMQGVIEGVLRFQFRVPQDQPLVLPGGSDAAEMVTMIVTMIPVLTGATFVPLLVGNLWAAGRAVAVSGRLVRPWERLSSVLMPRSVAIVTAGSLLVAQVGGFTGLLGKALFGALVMALALQGLAALHEKTLGRNLRGPMLGAAYVLLVLQAPFVVPALAAYGLVIVLMARPVVPAPPVST
jgi:hypothetical protein